MSSTRSRSRTLITAAVATLVALPSIAQSQIVMPQTTYERPRLIVGGDLVMAQPRRELADYITEGWGGNFTAKLRVEPQGLLHVRFDGGTARYGSDERNFSYGFRSYRLRTTNNIDWFAIGPEVAIPGGPIRPYVSAAVSLTRFRTTSSISDRNTSEEFDSVDNASDFTTGWVFGGGVNVPFGSRSALALNLGAKYHFGGEANFVREEDVRNAPIDADRFESSRSRANFVLWHLGLTYRIPRMRTGGTTP